MIDYILMRLSEPFEMQHKRSKYILSIDDYVILFDSFNELKDVKEKDIINYEEIPRNRKTNNIFMGYSIIENIKYKFIALNQIDKERIKEVLNVLSNAEQDYPEAFIW